MTGLRFAKPIAPDIQKALAATEAARWWEVVKAFVAERDRGRCRCCGGTGTDPHHVRYRSLGGADSTQNVVLLCRACHDEVQQHRIACTCVNANWPDGVVFGRAAQAPTVDQALAAAVVPCVEILVIDWEHRKRMFEYPLPLPDDLTLWRKDAVRRLAMSHVADVSGRPIYVEVSL